MIHLITLNPAIDNFIEVEDLKVNQTNYSKNQSIQFGGKAINVALVLKEFMCEATLLTTYSDTYKSFINSSLEGLTKNLIKVDNTRINTKITMNNDITEINSTGERLSKSQLDEFNNYISSHVKEDDLVLVAGNPHPDNYVDMIDLCMNVKKITKYLFLDSSKITLLDLKQIKPYFIKPNLEEISHILNLDLQIDKINEQISSLYDYVDNVMVSLGEEGIFYGNKTSFVKTNKIIGSVKNTVGAGDSSVAAVIYAHANNYSQKDTAILSAVTGSATAFSINLATKKEIDILLNNYK